MSSDVWFEPSAVNIGGSGAPTGVGYGERDAWSGEQFGEKAAISDETSVEGCKLAS